MQVKTPADAMKIKILLGRANIPYAVRNELTLLYTAQGNISFLVDEAFYPQALGLLEAAFEVNLEDLPDRCPACGTPSLSGKSDCPECGLFLA